MKNYAHAITDFDRAIELDPQYHVAYYYRGLAYCNQGDYDRAIADFDKAVELDPQDAEAYAERGFAYAQQGENVLAI
jgi:tetratricopeptide (TPR) repeat protein